MELSHITNQKNNPVPISLVKNNLYYWDKQITDIRDTMEYHFYFSATSATGSLGGVNKRFTGELAALTLAERGSLNRWKISLYNSHDQDAKVTLRPLMRVAGNVIWTEGNFRPNVKLWESDVGWLESNSKVGREKYITSLEGGGGSSNIQTVQELDGLHPDLCLSVKFSVAPTTGSLWVAFEAQG